MPEVNIIVGNLNTTPSGQAVTSETQDTVSERRFYGSTIDYSVKTNDNFVVQKPDKDTIYKPTSSERIGTSAVDSITRLDIRDSHYINLGAGAEGSFFSNIYALSSKIAEHFEMPLMSVNVKLIYQAAKKSVNPTLDIHDGTFASGAGTLKEYLCCFSPRCR